ncbi:MAG: hypothetical protein ACTHOD_19445 [Motilibacteraceae bacterium]
MTTSARQTLLVAAETGEPVSLFGASGRLVSWGCVDHLDVPGGWVRLRRGSRVWTIALITVREAELGGAPAVRAV